MTNDIPSGFIKNQSLISTPITNDATLVDDTAAIVDDSVALVGGPSAISEGIQGKVNKQDPRPQIPISR